MDIRKLDLIEVDETPPVLELSADEIWELAQELVDYHAEFKDLFFRKEQKHWSLKYLQGLMLPIERKAIQPMAQELEGGDIQALQQLIGQGAWQDQKILKKHRQLVGEALNDDEGIYIIDPSGFPKKGEHSVGVTRQWCGTLGKVDNCQVGVFGALVTSKGCSLVDARLYLPECWFDEDHQERWQACGIPDETVFQTKPELGLEMLQHAVEEDHLSFQWVTADEEFGRNPAFLDAVAGLKKWYVAEVPHNTRLWTQRPQTAIPEWSGKGRKPTKERVLPGEPRPQRVDQLAADIPAREWKAYAIKEGSKGPVVCQFAFRRLVAGRDGLPGPSVWVIFRRTLGEEPELKVYLSNAPARVSRKKLVWVVGMRWPIETVLQECKSGLGLDHYEVRTWLGWHHHITLCLVAHGFLLRSQHRLKKKRPH